jgi:hypothetical protein
LQDVAFNDDGSLKVSGKQNVKFYNKKRLNFKARPKLDAEGKQVFDDKGKPVFLIDPKTGIPFKDAFEEVVEMVRIETKGDTNIVDDVADELKKRQFYRHYKFFREGKIPDGNPIEDFEFLQPSTIMELHMLGIHVIQQVAEMSDLECERLKDQSGYEVRDIAAQWVKINSPQGQSGKASRLEIENAKLRRELEEARMGSRRGAPVESPALESSEPEAPVATVELTPEQFAAKRRPRKV